MNRRHLLSTVAAFGMVASLGLGQANAQDPVLPTEIPAGIRIVVADDANYVTELLRLSGEQDKLTAEVGYANFTSGPLRLEAIRAGAAQVGAVGDVPPILAQFSAAGVVIVGAVVTSGPGNTLATSPASGIQRIEDLRGKRVAVNDGTAQQAILLRNLKAAGLTINDIDVVNIGLSEFADALRGNQIDAAILKQPDRARYLASIAGEGAREIANAPGTNTNLKYLYASREALADPAQAAAIREFVVLWYRAHLWKNDNEGVWVSEYLMGDQRLSEADARTVWESEGDQTTVPGLDNLVSIQQETVDLLQAAGQFAGKPLDAREQFDLRFAPLGANTQLASAQQRRFRAEALSSALRCDGG